MIEPKSKGVPSSTSREGVAVEAKDEADDGVFSVGAAEGAPPAPPAEAAGALTTPEEVDGAAWPPAVCVLSLIFYLLLCGICGVRLAGFVICHYSSPN